MRACGGETLLEPGLDGARARGKRGRGAGFYWWDCGNSEVWMDGWMYVFIWLGIMVEEEED